MSKRKKKRSRYRNGLQAEETRAKERKIRILNRECIFRVYNPNVYYRELEDKCNLKISVSLTIADDNVNRNDYCAHIEVSYFVIIRRKLYIII